MREHLDQPRSGDRSDSVASKMAVLKHPIHPMLVVYPIALLSLVFVTDAAYLWLHDPFWARVSFWLNAAGLGLGLLAGVVGTLDMFLIRVVRRHVSAWNHFIAAVMVLALAAAGVWLRAPDAERAVWPWGLLLSGVTALMVMIAGWLGGTLSFRHGIGVYGEDDPGEVDDDAAPPAQ